MKNKLFIVLVVVLLVLPMFVLAEDKWYRVIYRNAQVKVNENDNSEDKPNDYFIKLSTPEQVYDPIIGSKVGMNSKADIDFDGYMLLQGKMWDNGRVIIKNSSGDSIFIQGINLDTHCPGDEYYFPNPIGNPNYKVFWRPACIYSRGGKLLYSFRSSDRSSRNYDKVSSVSGARSSCGDTILTQGLIDRDTPENCGSSPFRIELKKDDTIYFKGGGSGERGGSGIEFVKYGACHTLTERDLNEGQCTLGCPGDDTTYLWLNDTSFRNNDACCRDDPYGTNPINTISDFDDGDISLQFCKRCGLGNPTLRDWEENLGLTNGCCGDDKEDCGFVTNNNNLICAQNESSNWKWTNASNNKGQILESVCGVDTIQSYLSDGTEWISCLSSKPYCLDTEGEEGQANKESKGTVTTESEILPDKCDGNNTKTLIEYSCAGNTSKKETINCVLGCLNGACISTDTADTYDYTFTHDRGRDADCETPIPTEYSLVNNGCVRRVDGNCRSELCLWRNATSKPKEYIITSVREKNADCSVDTQTGYTLEKRECLLVNSNGKCTSDICLWYKNTDKFYKHEFTMERKGNKAVDCLAIADKPDWNSVNQECLRKKNGKCVTDICLWRQEKDLTTSNRGVETETTKKKLKSFDSNGVVASDEVSNPYNLQGMHSYYCYEKAVTDADGTEYFPTIAECCGSNQGDCLNKNVGTKLTTGESININGNLLFCRNDYLISSDLDNSKESCEWAVDSNGVSLGLSWTGSKCCGEPEDKGETYNDVNGVGACFVGETLNNSKGPDNNIKGLKAINGELKGCQLNDPSLATFVSNVPYCTLDLPSRHYCDYDGAWKLNANDDNLVQLSYALPSWSGVDAGCCEPNACWDGSSCVTNQVSDASGSTKGGYRCIDGTWTKSTFKMGLDGIEGYCPRDNQCLVSSSSKSIDNDNPNADPICIADGQYMTGNKCTSKDCYCDNGAWSTRSKLLTLTMLDIVQNPSLGYILYCGHYTDLLNYYTEPVGGYLGYKLFSLGYGQANELCVLDYNGGLILGMLLPNEYTDVEIGAFFPEYRGCNPTDADKLSSCTQATSDNAWVDKKLNMFFYSQTLFTFSNKINYKTIYDSFLSTPLEADALPILRQNSATSVWVSNELNETKLDLSWVYLAKYGNKKITTVLSDKNLVGVYEGTNPTNFCKLVNDYNGLYTDSDSTSRLVCIEKSGKAYLISKGESDGEQVSPEFIWPDLTGKLRLK